MALRCVLVIGHHDSSQGAENLTFGITEYRFAFRLAGLIMQEHSGETSIIPVHRQEYKGLPYLVNVIKPDFVISLHAGSGEDRSGTETFYYHTSIKGKTLARIVQDKVVKCLSLPDRGIKQKTVEDEGGYLLAYTSSPCVVSKSFFIDNDEDLRRVKENILSLAKAYIEAIEKYSSFIITGQWPLEK